jgi:hypothetical protein
MLEQRLAKMEKILLSPTASKNNNGDPSTATATTNEYDDDVKEEDEREDIEKTPISRSSTLNTSTEDQILSNNASNHYNHTLSNKAAKYNNTGSKYSSGEDNNHDAASPTSFSSISSNFPSPQPHILHQYPENRNDGLPCMSIIEHMVDLYFTYLFSATPIFEEVALRRDIRERKCPDFLLFSLLALCAR